MNRRTHLLVLGLVTPAVWALWLYRRSHWLWVRHREWLALAVACFARVLTGIEIHPAALLDRTVAIAHGHGIVIGEGAVVGGDCQILQGVTLGARYFGQEGLEHGRVHPRLGKHVRVGANAVLLGAITVGDGAIIGAGAIVLQDVPPGAMAVGNPARILEAPNILRR